jgi:hypothetical protein
MKLQIGRMPKVKNMALRDDILQAVRGYPLSVDLGTYRDGSDPGHPDYHAATAALIGRPVLGRIQLTYGSYSFRSVSITVSLNADQSWVSRRYWDAATPAQKASLATHEQGHMDIAFFVAWNLARSLLLLQAATYDVQLGRRNAHQAENFLRSQANGFIANADILQGRLQETYETQTEHGGNTEAQSRWTALFRRGLPDPPITLEDILRNNRIDIRAT